VEQLVLRLMANGLSVEDLLSLKAKILLHAAQRIAFDKRVINLDVPTASYLLKYLRLSGWSQDPRYSRWTPRCLRKWSTTHPSRRA
jgi:hypothetical protein